MKSYKSVCVVLCVFLHHVTLLIVSFLLVFLFPLRICNADDQAQPPNPGFLPRQNFNEIGYKEGFEVLWGEEHQYLDQNGVVTLMLNSSSGSGFKSQEKYDTLYFGADIKLPRVDQTSGLDVSLYLASQDNCSVNHDEIDMEFLGSVDGAHFHLQTNVIIADHSSKDGGFNNIGREMVFKLWFDPTEDFHNYAILKSTKAIIFLVDGYVIRRFWRRKKGPYPKLASYGYGSIWDASDWATENGKYKVDYNLAPFVAQYRKFQFGACDGSGCSVTPSGSLGLSTAQKRSMQWIYDNYKVYDYCENSSEPSLVYECSRS